MLWTVVAILLVLWILGMVASSTFGGLLHVLLILIIAAVIIEVVRPRRN
ncbi:MAG: lmo0937 family membrane protein [Planctomycetes bacterium]|nr:lmo0937 family membrane protein [Planctomycetota bacterium]